MNLNEQQRKKVKIILWLLTIVAIFIVGYYLRAYYTINSALPLSPYETFKTSNEQSFLMPTSADDAFTNKSVSYPTSYLLEFIVEPIIGNFYLIYLLGAIAIFFLGKLISGNNLGGFLAFALFTVSSENLIQYTSIIIPSGLCYVFIWFGLLFFLKYLKKSQDINLLLFNVLMMLAITTYHTGAMAAIIIFSGFIILNIFSNRTIDKKILLSFFSLITYYLIWILMIDQDQFKIFNILYTKINLEKIGFLIILILLTFLIIKIIKKVKWIESEYIPLIFLIPSTILIFSQNNFFNNLLSLGVTNYYSSTITLNNYIAQALLVNIYLIMLLPKLFKKELNNKYFFITGWLLGLIIISGGLIIENLYARIFDYSFPLMFVLFGLYWSQKTKFRNIVVPITIVLLIISQLIVFHDPFSMRRYYNQNEINSAKKIAQDKNIDGTISSDLRTSALLRYSGRQNVYYSLTDDKHLWMFYDYKNALIHLDNLANSLSIKQLRNANHDIYVVLSRSMETIVYAANFETKPIGEEVFEYYKNNYKEVYNDGLMMVYLIYEIPDHIKEKIK